MSGPALRRGNGGGSTLPTCEADTAGAGNAGHVESLRAVMAYTVADALEVQIAAAVVGKRVVGGV